TASVRITIHEGRNRQIRKMCEAIGHPVLFLKRVGTGEVFLGELKRGEWRYLTGEEVEYLKGV
ncbi:MAG: pseudouridine synthase, partial [Firmicutes bacterium]|nr:pseudouridine synthase [Bacillota bacterium]